MTRTHQIFSSVMRTGGIECLLHDFVARIIRVQVDATHPSLFRILHVAERCRNAVFGLAVAWAVLAASVASAQSTVQITGDRLGGFVLPIEPLMGNIEMSARNATTWSIDDTKRVLLSGDVKIRIGSREFRAQEAAIWLNRLPSQSGLINQIAVFFDEVGGPATNDNITANELLVTGSARGDVRLDVSRLVEDKPKSTPFTRRAEERLAMHLRRLTGESQHLRREPQVQLPSAPSQFVPVPSGQPPKNPSLPDRVQLPTAGGQTPWLVKPDAIWRFSVKEAEYSEGEQEDIISIVGPLSIDYIADRANRDLPQLTLSAERAVIFAEPGSVKAGQSEIDAGGIRGIYLEGNVNVTANNGQYSVRSPRVYYDFRSQRAIMLNAVLRAQAKRNAPQAIARAQEMRQIAEDQWTADRVIVSTSEFFTPHLAIGAETMTIMQRRDPASNEVRTFVESRGNTLQASGVPIFPWPSFSGDVEDVPLRSVEFGTRDNDGLRILTDWDLFTILGKRKPSGVDATLSLDGLTKRGVGSGLDFDYDVNSSRGELSLYGLYDDGVDRTSSGRNVEPENEFRGWALLEHQTQLSKHWTLQAQGAIISDETLFTAWREDLFTEEFEHETSVYLKHQRDNAALTLLAKYSPQDFLSNDYLLASRQYAVDKLPELAYRRYGDSLFGELFTYSMENRATRMALAFQHTTAREIGVREGAFPFDYDAEIADELHARGLREKWVNRVDSRHELAMPVNAGNIKLVPFVVGRFTGYDDDFEEFSSDTDKLRYFGAAGLRVSTQFQRVHNHVENRALDLHRLRHVIEPYLTLWHGDSNMYQFDFPVYDEEVESIADGSAVQFGLRNTWQTQRGGPGQWRSVDVFTLDTSVVFDSEGEPNDSAVPQFFEYWPEYSQFGDHIEAAASWLISDNLSIVGETIYALEHDTFSRGSIGAELRHSPLLVTYVEYRVIDISETELLGVGWTYQVTPKYRLALSPQYDFREEDFRALNARITRSFPDFDFTLQVRYDQIRDDTSVGASLSVVEF
jgi:lipopolysaccharide assembly outer membrane protein LptD (OstA)